MPAYSMAKVAMDMMTRCLAIELGPLGVRVNSIKFVFTICGKGIILTKFNHAIVQVLQKPQVQTTSLLAQ